MLAILSCLLLFGFFGAGIWASYNQVCPDCDGKMKNSNIHVCRNGSTMNIYECWIVEKSGFED